MREILEGALKDEAVPPMDGLLPFSTLHDIAFEKTPCIEEAKHMMFNASIIADLIRIDWEEQQEKEHLAKESQESEHLKRIEQ